MKITKLVHSCLLVEMPAPVNRTVLFDPGSYSTVDVGSLVYLDDIFITHRHNDHMDAGLIKRLQDRFPEVRITAPGDALDALKAAGVANVSTTPPDGVRYFESPHEIIRPLHDADPPEEHGIHYLEKLSHPGDSHSFHETMPVLALPVQAPWGSVVNATRLGLELKPKFIVPIHDWQWSDAARQKTYNSLEGAFSQAGITFIKAENGLPFVLEV